jgi:hypothetical protein
VAQGTIEGRRDIAGGRLAGDKRSLVNTASGQCFTSLTYSADGSQLLAGKCPKHVLHQASCASRSFLSVAGSLTCLLSGAGGRSKFVCIYDTEERLMLRRFQVQQRRTHDPNHMCKHVHLAAASGRFSAHHAYDPWNAGVKEPISRWRPGPAQLPDSDRCRASRPHCRRAIR